MDLMTMEIKEKLLKADENNEEILVKYFFPMGRYTFYALKGEEVEDDFIMWGYVLSPITPDFDEFGYVSLKELESIEVQGLKMERDLYFPDGLTVDEVLSN